MISIEEALEKILSTVHALECEEKPVLECLGQVLDTDIVAGIDIPPHDNSAMDGFAVISADASGAAISKPVILKVIGEVAAGYTSDVKVTAGTAVRIMTGAPIPAGADAVVQFENTDEVERKREHQDLDKIGILQAAISGLNVRRRGEDISKGQTVLKQGIVLRPAEIGVLASLGKSAVLVIRRPVVSVLSTGDELIDIKQPLPTGKIYDSNTYTIAASIMQCGGIPKIIGIGRDSVQSMNLKINEGLNADMLITSGGVSKGDYDVVKDVLAQIGKIGFWTVRMKPGKPLAFGVIHRAEGCKAREIPHLGLPGNPVSSMITFEMFARPAIYKMLGKKNWSRPIIQTVIDGDVINDDGRRVFARVRVAREGNGYRAYLTGAQGSGILTSMAAANGLAVIPEDCPIIKAGETVSVRLLDSEDDFV